MGCKWYGPYTALSHNSSLPLIGRDIAETNSIVAFKRCFSFDLPAPYFMLSGIKVNTAGTGEAVLSVISNIAVTSQ